MSTADASPPDARLDLSALDPAGTPDGLARQVAWAAARNAPELAGRRAAP